jgi:hypothetical protein
MREEWREGDFGYPGSSHTAHATGGGGAHGRAQAVGRRARTGKGICVTPDSPAHGIPHPGRPMGPPRRAVLTVMAIVAALGVTGGMAGCGADDGSGSATVPSVPSSGATGTADARPSADVSAAVADAYAALRSSGYEATGTVVHEADASAVDAPLRGAIEERFRDQASSTSSIRAESATRVWVARDRGARREFVVSYDGALYASRDGTTWARVTGHAAVAAAGGAGATSALGAHPTPRLTALREDGTGEVAGREAIRYVGVLDPARTHGLVAGVTGSAHAGARGPAEALTMGEGTATILVDRATGVLAEQQYVIAYSVDAGAIARATGRGGMGTGTVKVLGTATETVTRRGALTVERPRATRTVSTVTQLGEYLSG